MVRLIHVWFCKYSTTFGEGVGRIGVVTNVVVYESIRKGQKKLCFACLTDNHLSEKFSRWILANLSSFHTKRCYRKARLLQKNLLLKIMRYTHHPQKTTLSLLKQHRTVLECYNAYLNKEKQQAWFFLLRWLQWRSQLGASLYLGDSIFSVFRKTSFLPFQGDWRYTYSFLKYPMWFKLRNFKKWGE